MHRAEGDGAALLTREWLLTDGAGGFALGTALGVPTRRYHAWLVAATRPPVGRVAALHSFMDELLLRRPGEPVGSGQRVDLASAFFHGQSGPVLHPSGAEQLASFETDGLRCRWTYRWGPVEAVRELRLDAPGSCVVRYEVRAAGHAGALVVRPMTALRDAHALRREHASRGRVRALRVPLSGCRVEADGLALEVSCADAGFELAPDWWRNFDLPVERERGYDDREDLFTPGLFRVPLTLGAGDAPRVVEFRVRLHAAPGGARAPGSAAASGSAWLPPRAGEAQTAAPAAASVSAPASASANPALNPALTLDAASPQDREALLLLSRAAAQFIVARAPGRTIIAGYPWFTDWGRDSMISLPGLLLSTGRVRDARAVLETFARAQREGLVPNCFDDRTGEPQHNTVDASLWFLHACARLWDSERAAPDPAAPAPAPKDDPLRYAALSVVGAYRRGTRFGILRDPDDGLITAGAEGVALTWMDAVWRGTPVTPRRGKCVEINALWHSGLLELARCVERDEPAAARDLREMARPAGVALREKFWNAERGCLFDRVSPPASGASPEGNGAWTPEPDVRPNQVFAIALPHCPFTPQQQRSVVRVVRERLLTPMGLRTLDPADPAYCGRYGGDVASRDAAYHQGTVWPWLIGAYCDALLRTAPSPRDGAHEVRAALAPLLEFLRGPGMGTLPEVFDGDDAPELPRRAGGCPAQAWSVAEVLRSLRAAMIAERA